MGNSDHIQLAQARRDPYFDPPDQAKPGRATPFRDGSIFTPPPPVTPWTEEERIPSPPPAINEPRWKAPAARSTWQDRQPYNGSSGAQGRGLAELESALGSQAEKLLAARDLQRTAAAGLGIMAVPTSALLTEPAAKILKLHPQGVTAQQMKWLTADGALKNAWRGGLSTVVTGTVLVADEVVRDRMYGDSANSWGTTGLTVPLSLAFGSGRLGKPLLVAGSVIAGHLVDRNLPAPDFLPEAFRHFTVFDAIPLGIATSLPIRNYHVPVSKAGQDLAREAALKVLSRKGMLSKAGMIGAAWLAGNALEMAFTSSSTGEIEEIAMKAATRDKSERSHESLTEAVNRFRDLAWKNEVVLEHDLARLFVDGRKNYKHMRMEEKLASHRNMLAIARALGEHHLDRGTRLSIKETSEPTYVLPGLKLDMGADALTYLITARDSAKGSRALTEMMLNTFAYDKRVTEEEIKDLDRVKADLDRSIDAIVGKHDIAKAMAGLIAFIDRGTTSDGAIFNKEMANYKTFIEEINRKLEKNLPKALAGDRTAMMIAAKLLRDQALNQMADAAYKLSPAGDNFRDAGLLIFGSEQGRHQRSAATRERGDGALDALMLAEKLAPDNPDLPELKAIAHQLAERLRKGKSD